MAGKTQKVIHGEQHYHSLFYEKLFVMITLVALINIFLAFVKFSKDKSYELFFITLSILYCLRYYPS